MCGRFSLMAIAEVLTDRYSMSLGEDIKFQEGLDLSAIVKRYNVAPTQDVPVVTNKPAVMFSYLRWGFLPHWAKDQKSPSTMINARADTIMQKVSYKEAFRSTRCLVPSTGFFEWKRPDKTPYHFQLKDGQIFSMAGIWDSWKEKDGKVIGSFTIITTEHNELMKDIHDRMPVILDKESEKYWLEDHSPEDLIKLLRPFPAGFMKRYEVSKAVNSSREDRPEMVVPVTLEKKKSLLDF